MTNFNRKNPFKVPKGYFEELEKQLLKNKEGALKKSHFQVTKDYFDSLEKDVLASVRNLNNPPKRSFKSSVIYLVGIAASLVFIFSFFQTRNYENITPDEQAFNDYLEIYYSENLDSYEMLSMLEDNEIDIEFEFLNKP